MNPIKTLFTRETNAHSSETVPLVHWISRAYFRTSLIPLLIVEVALIVLYFSSNTISNKQNIEAVRQLAEQEVTQAAQREANGINRQLEGIAGATTFLRQQTENIMIGEKSTIRDTPARFAYSKDGAFYSTRDTGGAALFYSGNMLIGEKEREKAYRSAGLDQPYIGIKQAFPLIVQLYYNTFDSMNRIYPYFDVLSQYPAKMDIPSYNFYYEANQKYNPQRKVVWTDVYVDPAGQGWMTSAIAPVYSGDFLEGVVGVDVTVNTIIRDVLDLKLPWDGYGLLVSRTGTIIALPNAGEADWGLREFTDHNYAEVIKKDTFKPADFNLFDRTANPELAKSLRSKSSGVMHANLNGKRIVSWATIPETGWKLLVTVPEEKVYATSQSLAERLNTIAWLMVGGMLIFYIVFFSMLFRRAKQMSEFVSKPLEDIDRMIESVASGQYKQRVIHFPVAELSRTANGIVSMSKQLNDASQLREQAELALIVLTQRLQSAFDLSPDGFIATNTQAEVVLVNPAFCRLTGTEANQWLGLSESALWRELAKITNQSSFDEHQASSLELEITTPHHKVVQCEIRNINDAASASGKVIYLHDKTQEDDLNKMRNQFLSTAAHELRTPLTSVLGFSELLLNDLMSEESKNEALNAIVGQSRWLVKILNDLMRLTNLEEHGVKDFIFIPYPADALVIDTLSQFETPKGRTGIRTELLSDVLVNVDAEKFKIVLTNVLENAYKYSSSGDVTLRIVQKTNKQEAEGAPSARIGFEVKDHGLGMTDAQLVHIFERFWRADDSGNIPGTGLGMSIAHELMLLLKGDIEIISQLGQGTSVTLWFNQAQEDDAI